MNLRSFTLYILKDMSAMQCKIKVCDICSNMIQGAIINGPSSSNGKFKVAIHFQSIKKQEKVIELASVSEITLAGFMMKCLFEHTFR